MLHLLLMSVAWGQPAPKAAPLDPKDEAALEITVYGSHAIQAARSALVREMERLGYKARDRDGGEVVFRPPQRWMGRARFDADGDLTFGRPVVAFQSAELAERVTLQNNPNLERDVGGMRGPGADGTQGYALPTPAATWYVLPSMRVLGPVRDKVRAVTADEVREYQQVVRNTRIQADILELRDKLDVLWETGEPLGSGEMLASPAERRAAVLGYWAGRTDSLEGRALSLTVEKWLRRVVQSSQHPVTDAERAHAEAARADGRSLAL